MINHTIAILCFLLLTACATNTIEDREVIGHEVGPQTKINMNELQSIIDRAYELKLETEQQNIIFFSPNNMAQADTALNNLKNSIKGNRENNEVAALALSVQEFYMKGLNNKVKVLDKLKLSFDGLAMLEKLNTQSILNSEYLDIKESLKKSFILVEENKVTIAIDQQNKTLININKLETKMLKIIYLGIAEKALQKAKDTDAKDFATDTYKAAEKYIEKLSLFIETSPEQRDSIKEKSNSAVRFAIHAENVAIAAKAITRLTPKTAEEYILFIEKLLSRIAIALNSNDVSHLKLNSQSISITQTAETVSKQAETQINIGIQIEAWSREKLKLLNTIEILKKQINANQDIEN
ncbi:MAG: hypothetical protein ACJAYK_002266 [Crocinitomicaceae bacterium]|jgi:hypothetical protein